MSKAMRDIQLVELFEAAAFVDAVDLPRGAQLRLLTSIAGLYERHGLVVDGATPRLWDCCPLAHECWRQALDARPRDAGERSGISLPWIGPAYRRGGVAVLALNLRDAGGIVAEYEITCRTGGDGSQLSNLAAGRRTAHGSRIAYASSRSAAAIQDWLAGRAIADREAPQDLVAVLESLVRLQAVKCSPQDGKRSTPTPPMAVNCPALLLQEELAILKPKCALTLGTQAWQALEAMPGYTEIDWADQLSCGQLKTQAGNIRTFSLAHPASGRRWDEGHQHLLEYLRTRHAHL